MSLHQQETSSVSIYFFVVALSKSAGNFYMSDAFISWLVINR